MHSVQLLAIFKQLLQANMHFKQYFSYLNIFKKYVFNLYKRIVTFVPEDGNVPFEKKNPKLLELNK